MLKYILVQQDSNTGIRKIYNDKREAVKDGKYFRRQLTKHDEHTEIYVLEISEKDILKSDDSFDMSQEEFKKTYGLEYNCIPYEELAIDIINL